MEAAVWGFIGTVIGALASIGTSYFAARSASAAQRERMRLEWNLQYREFQIKAVTELQEILFEFSRATGRIRAADERREAQANGAARGPALLGEDLSEKFSQLIRRINVLLGRIDDKEVRKAISAAKDVATTVAIGVGVDMATMMAFSARVQEADDSLAKYLKSIYEKDLAV